MGNLRLAGVPLDDVITIPPLLFPFSTTILQKVHEELQFYRQQYIKAAEELCSSRHVSNLPDVSGNTCPGIVLAVCLKSFWWGRGSQTLFVFDVLMAILTLVLLSL